MAMVDVRLLSGVEAEDETRRRPGTGTSTE